MICQDLKRMNEMSNCTDSDNVTDEDLSNDIKSDFL